MYSDFTGIRINGQILDASPKFANVRGGLPNGRVLYVCSLGGPDGTFGDGKDINYPLATLGGASGGMAKLEGRTNKGDVIYVLPGHVESVSAADYFSHTGAATYFSVIGIGNGTNRPKFTWTAATSTWLFDTAGVELANCILELAGAHVTGAALTVAAPITVSANNCRIVNCEIFWGFENDRLVGDGIIVTGDGFHFIGNKCLALVAAVPTNTFLVLTGADDCVIRGNWIEGPTDATTKGVIDGETTESLRLIVEDNYLSNNLASSTIALSPVASSTGHAARNMFFVNSGILPITASLLSWYENYVVNGAGEAGALVGTASA